MNLVNKGKYKNMKYNYWVIYILPEFVNDISAFKPNTNDFVYAYTDSKEILDNFISFHDMSKFIVKKYKFEKSECRILNMEYQNRYLRLMELKTGKNGGIELITMALSIDEKNLLDNTKYSMMWKISNIWTVMTFNIATPGLSIFNKKYKKLLKLFKLHNFILDPRQLNCDDDIFDEFVIYYDLFSNLLK